jgi:hypothetical protein
LSAGAAASLRFAPLDLPVELAPLLQELARLPESSWVAHFNTAYHDGGWSGAALLSDDGDAARLYADASRGAQAGRATPLLAACPTFARLLERLPGPACSARLLRLKAGAVIREHRDHGLGPDHGLVRLHLPLLCPPELAFYVDDVRVPMRVGELWYLDLGLPHRVHNAGASERVHLVVDLPWGDALHALLPPAGQAEALVRERLAAMASVPDPLALFGELAMRDAELLARLRGIQELTDFIPTVQQLAAERGLRLDAESLRAAVQAGRRRWLEQRGP